MSRLEIDFKAEGMREIESMMKRLGKVPQQSVSKAARAGIKIPLKAAKRLAPRKTGTLRKSLKTVREKKWPKGKSVYQVQPSAAFNDRMVKMTKTGIRYYYPSAQEYGFKTVNGGYVEGLRYLRRAMTENAGAIEDKILGTLKDDLQKALNKG